MADTPDTAGPTPYQQQRQALAALVRYSVFLLSPIGPDNNGWAYFMQAYQYAIRVLEESGPNA